MRVLVMPERLAQLLNRGAAFIGDQAVDCKLQRGMNMQAVVTDHREGAIQGQRAGGAAPTCARLRGFKGQGDDIAH